MVVTMTGGMSSRSAMESHRSSNQTLGSRRPSIAIFEPEEKEEALDTSWSIPGTRDSMVATLADDYYEGLKQWNSKEENRQRLFAEAVYHDQQRRERESKERAVWRDRQIAHNEKVRRDKLLDEELRRKWRLQFKEASERHHQHINLARHAVLPSTVETERSPPGMLRADVMRTSGSERSSSSHLSPERILRLADDVLRASGSEGASRSERDSSPPRVWGQLYVKTPGQQVESMHEQDA